MSTVQELIGYRSFIKKALKEDIGSGDITSDSIFLNDTLINAKIVANEEGILAGIDIVGLIFKTLSMDIDFHPEKIDKEYIYPHQIIARLYGSAKAILSGERTALNLLTRLSGIATLTHKYVKELNNFQTKLVDTRKTTPLLRKLEKYAVRCGGGYSHRMGLFDGILIKDNHIKVVGSIKEVVERARANATHTMKIEVETQNIEEVKDAIASDVDIIMLDNMNLQELKSAVRIIREGSNKCLIEVSGGVQISDLTSLAELGVDFISVGALTNSARGLDFNLEVVTVESEGRGIL